MLDNPDESVMPGPRRTSRRKVLGSLLIVAVLAVGLSAVLIASQSNFDLRQFAWGGIRIERDVFEQADPEPDLRTVIDRSQLYAGQVETFHNLTQTYWDADVANISLPEFDFSGVAFKAFDPDLGTTFIFARLENVPVIDGEIMTAWLEPRSGGYVFAGLLDLTAESGYPVAYLTFPLEGAPGDYKTLHISYDQQLRQAFPGNIFVSIDFEEQQ